MALALAFAWVAGCIACTFIALRFIRQPSQRQERSSTEADRPTLAELNRFYHDGENKQ